MIRFRFNGFFSTDEKSQPGFTPGHPDGLRSILLDEPIGCRYSGATLYEVMPLPR
jgi:hypothetical protein